ncbi:MAG: 2-phospho-L-lactate guanylyltransferase [Pseudomonadota bacterium]
MWAIVPLKYFVNAKSRLSDLLSPDERQTLVRLMARDVLGALAATTGLRGVLIVSREPEVGALAAEFDARVFEESESSDLSAAVTAASAHAVSELGANGTLIVHADLPLAQAEDFDALLAGHVDFSLVPDDANLGTNCIAATPPNPIEYRYDGRSFEPHLDAARRVGLEPLVCEIPRLRLDIDTEQDVAALLATPSPSRTADWLRAQNMEHRLQAAT